MAARSLWRRPKAEKILEPCGKRRELIPCMTAIAKSKRPALKLTMILSTGPALNGTCRIEVESAQVRDQNAGQSPSCGDC